METRSRTEYSITNATVAVVVNVLTIFMGYIVRVVFTHVLNASYVGVAGLFTDIIAVLSLSELGIGTAVTFALYKPIQQGDYKRQRALMQLFCRFYHVVRLAIFLFGLAVYPFLDLLIRDATGVSHIKWIYVIYILNAMSTYVFTYKTVLVTAHQKDYYNRLIEGIGVVLQDFVQIGILVYTKNFILYLVTNMVFKLTFNYLMARNADRLYPYLKDKTPEHMSKLEEKEIFRSIRAMMMHKVGDVAINNTDNMVMSACIGILSVSKYSNYVLIVASLKKILEQGIGGITASIGNVGVSEDRQRVQALYKNVLFIGQWIAGASTILLWILVNPFIALSFGEQYIFEDFVVGLICLIFYLNTMMIVTKIFRDALGLFWYDRYKALIEAGLNIALSIGLALKLGVAGVFFGTILSHLLTTFWVEPYILYRYRFKDKLYPYFIRYGIYMGVTLLAAGITREVVSLYEGSYMGTLGLGFLAGVLLPNLIYVLVYGRTAEFRFVLDKLKLVLKQRIGHGAQRL